MKTSVVVILLSVILTTQIFGQKSLRHSPLQVSFVYPLGTHGIQTRDYSFGFSLNILTGYTGTVDGFEVGGLLNMNSQDVSGFQVGGLGNITNGNVDGLQVGGLFSLCDSMDGAQISGIFGRTTQSEGLQVAGIINISNSAGNTIAGLVNINNTLQNGIQIAGIYNHTSELRGVQIGLINRADTISKGLSIGLINLIKKGYFDEFAISVADYMNIGLSYKLGIKKFYTVYTVGMNYTENGLWVAGLGLGHLYEINPRFALQPEILWYTYFPVDFYRIRDTYSSHLKIGLLRKLGPSTAISFAPSLYLAWKSNRNIYDTYGYKLTPINPFFDVRPAGSDNQLEFGFGLEVALHFGM